MAKIDQLIINELEEQHSGLRSATVPMFDINDATIRGPMLHTTLAALKRKMLELISYDWAVDNMWKYGGGIGVQGNVIIFSYEVGMDKRPMVACRVQPKDGCEFKLILDLDATNLSEETPIFCVDYGVIELKEDLAMVPPFMSALQSIALIERVIEEHNDNAKTIQKKKK